MSFVYAEKYRIDGQGRESAKILSDTKIMSDNYTTSHFSEAGADLVLKYGIVKSTICCPELCVSFAGNNISFAAKLFRILNELKSFDPKEVANYAYDIHLMAPSRDDIEFIITYYSDEQVFIDCIKDGKIERNCQLAHIGSEVAFREFQSLRLSSSDIAAKQTERAFQEVVANSKDHTVGGRVFEVCYDYHCNSFVFSWFRSFHDSRLQKVASKEAISFSTAASDGAYSYEVIHINIETTCFIIDQMEKAILYSRRIRISSKESDNPNLFGLMLPMLVNRNEEGLLGQCCL